MKRIFGVILLSSLLFACGANKSIPLGQKQLAYEAAGNDVANIQLGLYDSKQFVFEVTPVSPEIGDDADIKEVGTYTEEDNWYVLHFPEKTEFDVYALFDQELDGTEWYEIIDKNTVKIRKDIDAFYLWGILIERK